jgi:hypothetical protein
VVVLPSTGASRKHNCWIDDGSSPKYFGYTLVSAMKELRSDFVAKRVALVLRMQDVLGLILGYETGFSY